MKSRVLIPVLTVALVALTALPSAAAQQAATLTVAVMEKGGVVPGAVVLLTGAGGQPARRITNSSGVATFSGLAAGSYDLKVTYVGFAPFVQEGIALAAGEEKSMEVTLTLAQFSETVTITTANRREELLRKVAEPTTLIDLADILDTGGRTAKDILIEQTGSGVLVQPGGGQGHISINGIPNKGVLILIDGKRWLGKNSLGEFNIEDLDMSKFERIEIVKGAGSALYGSDALGGVINFISKRPDYGLTNSLNFSYGTYNDANFSDIVGYRDDRLSATISGSYRTTDGFDLDPDNPQTIGQPESQFYEFGSRFDYIITDNIIGRFQGDYSLRKVDNYFFGGATQFSPVYNSKREKTRYTLSPGAEIFLGADTSLDFDLIYSKYNREETQTFVLSGLVDELDPWQEWLTEFDATGKHAWSAFDQEHFFQAGYEYRKEEMQRANMIVPGTTGDSKADRSINVFWMQNEFNLTPQFKFTAGFRYDDYSDFGSEFSPKLSAVYALTDEHTARFSYGHGFRAPRFGELYLDLGFFFKGNPELLPETSDSVTVGYSYTSPLAVGSFDYFRTNMKNGIVFDFGVFPWSYKNEVEYTAQGINTAFSLNLPNGITPSFAYTFVKREDKDGNEILGYPRHSGFFKIVWANPRWGARANLRAQFLNEVTFSSGESQPGYQIWYLQGSKRLFTTDRYTFGLYAQVDNLLDRKDIFLSDESGAPIQGDFQVWLAPRTFRFGVSVDLDWTGSS